MQRIISILVVGAPSTPQHKQIKGRVFYVEGEANIVLEFYQDDQPVIRREHTALEMDKIIRHMLRTHPENLFGQRLAGAYDRVLEKRIEWLLEP